MAVTVTIDSSVLLRGETVQIAATITGLEKGLSGFDLTLAIDPAVTVENIIFPQYGLTALPPENTETLVRLRAVDLNRIIEGVSGPFELFTFDLVGHTVGAWSIDISSIALDDDDGSDLLPLTTFVGGVYSIRSKDVTDLGALRTALENDARYDAAVRGGSLTPIFALLNQPEIGQTRFLDVPSEDLLEAIGDGARGLSAGDRETLHLFINRESIDFRKLGIRDGIRELWGGPTPDTAVLGRITAVSERMRTFGEAFTADGKSISKQDLWAVLKDIPKSSMATKKVADDVKAVANEATIATLQAAIQAADPTLTDSAARSQAIREMYDTGAQA